MLMQAAPIYDCYCHVLNRRKNCGKLKVIYLTPQGKVLTQKKVISLSKSVNPLFLICGHYEGIDQRILDLIVDEEISIGDYVLTGGELAALVLLDSIIRNIPGVLTEKKCYEEESHYNGLLEYPQYTRPRVWKDMKVPEILLSGNHAEIEKWRIEKSKEITYKKRPDMLNNNRKRKN